MIGWLWREFCDSCGLIFNSLWLLTAFLIDYILTSSSIICRGYWFLSRLSFVEPLTAELVASGSFCTVLDSCLAKVTLFLDAVEYSGEFPTFYLDSVLALPFCDGLSTLTVCEAIALSVESFSSSGMQSTERRFRVPCWEWSFISDFCRTEFPIADSISGLPRWPDEPKFDEMVS